MLSGFPACIKKKKKKYHVGVWAKDSAVSTIQGKASHVFDVYLQVLKEKSIRKYCYIFMTFNNAIIFLLYPQLFLF